MSIIDDFASIRLWMEQIKADRDAAIVGKPEAEERTPPEWAKGCWNNYDPFSGDEMI